jgi:hypothetical protein
VTDMAATSRATTPSVATIANRRIECSGYYGGPREARSRSQGAGRTLKEPIGPPESEEVFFPIPCMQFPKMPPGCPPATEPPLALDRIPASDGASNAQLFRPELGSHSVPSASSRSTRAARQSRPNRKSQETSGSGGEGRRADPPKGIDEATIRTWRADMAQAC